MLKSFKKKTCQNFLHRDWREGCFDPISIGLAQDTPPARAASSQNTPISQIQIQILIQIQIKIQIQIVSYKWTGARHTPSACSLLTEYTNFTYTNPNPNPNTNTNSTLQMNWQEDTSRRMQNTQSSLKLCSLLEF